MIDQSKRIGALGSVARAEDGMKAYSPSHHAYYPIFLTSPLACSTLVAMEFKLSATVPPGVIPEPPLKKDRAKHVVTLDGPPTKSPSCDDPEKPATGCEFHGCERTKNLWSRMWGRPGDEKKTWFCWPHYQMAKNKIPPYGGRNKHHDYAKSKLERQDYPYDERESHHAFAKRFLSGDPYRS